MGEHQMMDIDDEVKRLHGEIERLTKERENGLALEAALHRDLLAVAKERDEAQVKCGKLRALASKLAGFVPCSMGTTDLLDEIQEVLHQ